MKTRFICALLLCATAVFSQSAKEKEADAYFKKYSFDEAIRRYEKVGGQLSEDGLRRLSESYFNRSMYIDAEKSYSRLLQSPNATVTVNDCYNYILSLKALGRYAEIQRWYEKIKQLNPKDLRAKNYFATKDLLLTLQTPDEQHKVQNLQMNSEEADFGTSFYSTDKIVFASTRRQGFQPVRRDYNWNQKPYLNIFEADREENLEFGKINYWNKDFNDKWHQGPAAFAENASFVAFTRNTDASAADGVVRLQIYFSEWKDGGWAPAEGFYLNNPDYSVGHAALTEDGNTMYFSSDMPGGYGGADIYVVQRNPETRIWGVARNMGDKINTEANELFPFYHDKDSLLFFASNGLNGLGGLDIYVSKIRRNNVAWMRNVGSPVNTRHDDFAYIIDRNLKYGYLSSDRPEGKGDDDIYKFLLTCGECFYADPKDPSEHNLPPKPVIPLGGYDGSFTHRVLVLNKNTRKPIGKADVYLGELKMTTEDAGLVSKEYSAPIHQRVLVDAIGYRPEQIQVSVPTFRNGYVITDTVWLGAAINEKIVLNNIYYDFDKSNILPESSVELDKVVRFLNDNPDNQIELSSHTDSRGSDEYNMALSERRAQSAVDYVISKGVDKERITAKGYGETQPVNNCTNDVPCTEPEHRQNRRTEIFITGYGKAQDIIQTKGKK
ncbi:MAG: OmpA family protein [Prevotellaceae bacterium]|jgi:outer membrane protein OmpA-like peptidoglycan-associated protein/tetratricopeptide (TPR) repeat protein|nr:OmpA family protein [Prevotellaceae bacterium]